MKINCPKCKKPFQLASKRLSGQVVKIRCSSCGTVFKVRGKPRARQQDIGAAKPLPAAPAISWFAVVGRKRVGPFGQSALERLIAGGKVRPETRLWRKGLEAWAPAGELEDLDGLFPAPVAAEADTVRPVEKPKPPSISPQLPMTRPAMEAVPEPLPDTALKDTADPESTDEALAGWQEDSGALERDEETAEGFFEAGVQADHVHREMESIDFGEPEVEPISIEETGVARGARETLRDFSVMARLSSKDRRRKTALLVVLAMSFAGALTTVFVMGKEYVFTGKQRDLVREESGEDLAIFASESGARNKPRLRKTRSRKNQGSLETDPLGGEEEWGTLDDSDLAALERQLLSAGAAGGDMAIDKQHFRERFEKKDGSSSRVRRKTPKKDEMVDWGGGSSRVAGTDGGSTDLSSMVPHRRPPKAGNPASDGIAITARSKVVDKVETAGGGFLGGGSIEEGRVKADVKERKSSGKLWKLRAKTNVMRKVRAQTKKIKRCADISDVDSGVKVFLHVSLDGRVTSVSSPKGGGRFTGCLMEIFGNFRVIRRRLEKRIKMPVILRFE